MATESIGTLIPTAIPGYTDSADIQAALRAYHYGSYSYDPANTSPGSLVTPSIAKTIYDIEADIVALENRPSSGGEVNATEPVPGDFTPPSIPDGFIWVDSDGSTGNGPYSATSVFTNSAPTANLTTGVIWVDKDPTSITVNPFIPQTIIGAKGDIVIGTANDTASVLNAGTNGFVLSANSATTSGLEWVAQDDSNAIQNALLTTTGDTIYASGASTPARLGIGTTGQVLTVSGGVPSWATPSAAAPAFAGCSVYNSASFSISSGVDTTLTWNSEFFDTNAFHDTSTNTDRITIPTGYGGKYQISVANRWEANGTGNRNMTLFKNGAKLFDFMDMGGFAGSITTVTRTIILNLAAGDYISIKAFQNSGSTLTMYAREYEAPFQVGFLGA
jgi:hypothetical protein